MAVYTSPYPEVQLPETDIWGVLFEREPDFPADRPLYIDTTGSRQYTYSDVRSTAIAFNHALRTHWNWAKGDVLSVFSPNCIDTPALIWGAHYSGGIVSPANPAYSVDEYVYQLKDSGSKAILTQAACLEVAAAAAKKVGIPSSRVLVMGDVRKAAGATYFTDFIASAGAVKAFKRTANAPTDLAFLAYSSGTTGLPKGVMLSHRNIVAQMFQVTAGQSELSGQGGPEGKGDKILSVLPFYHIYGLTMLIHHSCYKGITTVVMPQFVLEDFCRIIQDQKITYIYLAPPVVLALGKAPIVDKYDLSSLKMVVSGAAPLTRDLVEAVWKRLGLRCKQAYGLTETSPGVHIQRFEDWQTKIGSVGVILPNQTVKVMSPETGKPVEAGAPGEIWVKGPNVFSGYLNKPEATANSITADGYFMTGDIGYADADGSFYITDRVKELIKYKGFQVPPAELEGLLLGHDAVADVCVLGIYNADEATEVPRAYVVRTAESKQKDEEEEKTKGKGKGGLSGRVRAFLDAKVAKHKKLRGGVVFVDEIPKTASGKILRRVLKQRMADADKEKEKEEGKEGKLKAKL